MYFCWKSAIFDDQSFNDILNNNIVGFEQLGPWLFFVKTFAKFKEDKCLSMLESWSEK